MTALVSGREDTLATRPGNVSGPADLRRELDRAAAREWSATEASAYCAALAVSHYENFSVLSRLVPADLRPDFAAVYAYCRWSDDLADETGVGDDARAESLALLARWRAELDACFSGAEVRHPVFVALRETIRRRAVTPRPFHKLLGAFEQDQRITRYETWDQLLAYCDGSANPVGRIVLELAGRRQDDPADAPLFAMSDATCTALQLTNFWQDVRRDLQERDRVYLPSAETGLSAAELSSMMKRPNDPEARITFIRALRPLVERTRALFAEGRTLPSRLDPSIAPVVRLFGEGGESVLNSVEAAGCATLWTRPTLSPVRKAFLVMRAAIGALRRRPAR